MSRLDENVLDSALGVESPVFGVEQRPLPDWPKPYVTLA